MKRSTTVLIFSGALWAAFVFMAESPIGWALGAACLTSFGAACVLAIKEKGGFRAKFHRELEAKRRNDAIAEAEKRGLQAIQLENYHAQLGRQRAADRYAAAMEHARRQAEYGRRVKEEVQRGLDELFFGSRKRNVRRT